MVKVSHREEKQGGNVVSNKLWQCAPEWLSDKTKWPPEVILEASTESDKQIKCEQRSSTLNVK